MRVKCTLLEDFQALESPTRSNVSRCISKEEVKEVVLRMRHNRVLRLGKILIEVWKCLGVKGLEWLTSLFNVILRMTKIVREWHLSKMIPLYKKMGDVQQLSNYKGIKLLSHTTKCLKGLSRDG